jgi:prophage regulatory protein
MIAEAQQLLAEAEDDAPEKTGLRRMMRLAQVLEVVPVSGVTLWRMEKSGRLPKGTFISPNKKVWYEDEIIAWQREVNGRGRGRQHHPSRKAQAMR